MSDYALQELLARRSSRMGRALASGEVRVKHKHAVPFDEHKAIADGRRPGVMTQTVPEWKTGEHVTVTTQLKADDRRDDLEPTRMVVTHVDPVEVGKLTQAHAKHLGFRLPSDAQRLALGNPKDIDTGRDWSAERVNMAARGSTRVVWITRWVQQDRDTVRFVRAGMQPPTGTLQFRATDAGEAVDAQYQRDLCADAEPLNVARQEQRRAERRADADAKRAARKAARTAQRYPKAA